VRVRHLIASLQYLGITYVLKPNGFQPFQIAPDGKQHLYLNEGKERLKELEGATVHFPGGPSWSPLLLSFLVLERPG
jgi:hypothetical protein